MSRFWLNLIRLSLDHHIVIGYNFLVIKPHLRHEFVITWYNHAFHLYTLIYENHTASECGDEHASLASLINKAANVDEETLKLRMAEEYESAMTSADLQYIRKQEEKARAQITGDEGKTARRKLMRRWEEEKCHPAANLRKNTWCPTIPQNPIETLKTKHFQNGTSSLPNNKLASLLHDGNLSATEGTA